MPQNNIVILDYTLGNLFSLKRAFQKIGCDPLISDNKEDIINAEKVVLPGVGAFAAGMEGLEKKGLVAVIKEIAGNGKPILGICLGMQMMMTQSEEGGLHRGLDLIKGKVTRFDSPGEKDSFKIPHYGWSSVSIPERENRDAEDVWHGTIFEGIKNPSYFYFVHSYFVTTDDPMHTVGITTYGYNSFASVIRKDNITGCQFHPEISGEAGLQIIRNFALHQY